MSSEPLIDIIPIMRREQDGAIITQFDYPTCEALGLKKVDYIHPELEEPLKEVLEVTYGLIVYQEQVQRIAQIVAGYTLGAADLLRRAMGKKKPEVLAKEFEPFSAGMRGRGYSEVAIEALWKTLVPFADYAFNKA